MSKTSVNPLTKTVSYGTYVSGGSGECLILLGRNGVGKTLLLNILATLVEPTSGTVSIDGVDAFRNLKQVRPSIGYILSHLRDTLNCLLRRISISSRGHIN